MKSSPAEQTGSLERGLLPLFLLDIHDLLEPAHVQLHPELHVLLQSPRDHVEHVPRDELFGLRVQDVRVHDRGVLVQGMLLELGLPVLDVLGHVRDQVEIPYDKS